MDFARLVSSPSLRKHRIIKQASSLLSYKTYRRALIGQNPTQTKRNEAHKKLVKLFLEEDINSKMCPEKRYKNF